MRTPFILPPRPQHAARGWIALAIFAAITLVCVPVLHLLVPASHPLHLRPMSSPCSARSCATPSSPWPWT
jgi:hypothetical protein